MSFDKFYEKSNRANVNLSLDEFTEKLQDANGSFISELHSKYMYRTKDEILKPYQVELIKLQEHLEKHNEKMIILMEGRDASGKGGAIRRITRYMNEKHYRVVALGKPSDVQKTQWYYQRYVEQFPKGGEIVIFDRSWYNRAMVEPVFGFCSDKEYEVFMRSVPRFEEELIDHGIHFLKIYLSVSKDEQARRFEEREENPLKQWKLSEIDMQMQSRWEEFTQKKYDMLKQTNTDKSPWTIIRSDTKFLARLNSIKVILNSVDYEGRDPRLDYEVDKDIVITAKKELEIMDYKKKAGITQGLI
ncbi:polyphosphate kinase 2 [Arcobacter porcinus]|uniref:ADP/GDP-polyphosphate phosphotransferase n=1 Tax=Arcobacter porcinus TaxID=1935204 RepID=A0A1C0AYV7_9BACT|nr:polyphosphate kinase 2 [Arcobacter porcinus]OCL96572.1 Polyphosphate kinase 2 (PPK2) [Aliarcobacter thereius]OCL83613.1 Polyphosphate kinase 2 (PPK2) [Arcobacter porcinus]OCL83832.1 Polyphosphate kinase 2 (PPK2) [Arcobacter porcinus]OCL85901.1 Polyphosphate kinase 2 (PPK2) [Arcobacter porcinus]OCL92825.1 Polyphosphate kinase 2 (PPK2) [Arcobacter porcinus]